MVSLVVYGQDRNGRYSTDFHFDFTHTIDKQLYFTNGDRLLAQKDYHGGDISISFVYNKELDGILMYIGALTLQDLNIQFIAVKYDKSGEILPIVDIEYKEGIYLYTYGIPDWAVKMIKEDNILGIRKQHISESRGIMHIFSFKGLPNAK